MSNLTFLDQSSHRSQKHHKKHSHKKTQHRRAASSDSSSSNSSNHDQGRVCSPKIVKVESWDSDHCELIKKMDKVWFDHAVFFRQVKEAVLSAAPAIQIQTYTLRLLSNPQEIGKIFAKFYGVGAGLAITNLLETHVRQGAVILGDILRTQGQLNDAQSKADIKAWYDNGHAIAGFLNSVNPGFDLDTGKAMMEDHLRTETKSALAYYAAKHSTGDWSADVKALDDSLRVVRHMAAHMAEGISKQKGLHNGKEIKHKH